MCCGVCKRPTPLAYVEVDSGVLCFACYGEAVAERERARAKVAALRAPSAPRSAPGGKAAPGAPPRVRAPQRRPTAARRG